MRTKARPLRILAKSKLQNRHARKVKLVPDRLHLRRDDAKILRNDRQFPDLRFQRREQVRARTLHPLSRGRRGRARLNLPVGLESAKVVDPHNVVQTQRRPETFHPPAVGGLLQQRPVIDGIAPKLSGSAESRAGNILAFGVGSQAKHLPIFGEIPNYFQPVPIRIDGADRDP